MTIADTAFRNRFSMKQILGRGAAGEVHLAYDNYLQREVALKIAHPEQFENSEDGQRNRKMWLNETRLAGKLQHPFIIELIEAGSSDKVDYLVMEYVAGGSLKQHTTPDNLLPTEKVVDILFKLCNALEYAHKMGVLHRDIKPSNILMGKSTVKISDFGSAFLLNSEHTQVDTVGTLPFMAPEHFRQSRPTMQSDVYAVGVLAYQLLTGKLPFTARTHEELLYQKLHNEFLPLENLKQDIPQILRFIVHRAMHADKELRYSAWEDLEDDLSTAFPQKARHEETRFDSSRFKIIRNLAFFSAFSDTEIWEMVGTCNWLEKKQGDTIVKEGEASNSLYFIVEGQVTVSKMGSEVSRLSGGDCFGEMAYLDSARQQRLASVTALSGMKLVEISESSLLSASAGFQAAFAKAFLNLMVSRLGNAYQRISELEKALKESGHPAAMPKPVQSAGKISLKHALGNVQLLPTLPQLSQKLLQASADRLSDENQILHLIEQNTQVLAHTIALANFPAFGATGKKISSIKEAAMLMGISKVKAVATCLSFVTMKTTLPAKKFKLSVFWLHNMSVAFSMLVISRYMPRDMRPDDEDILLAGILHDIGYLTIASLSPAYSDTLHEAISASTDKISLEIETAMCDTTHIEIGAALAASWKLPKHIIEVIRHHHHPDSQPDNLLARLLNVSEKLQPAAGMPEYTHQGVSAEEWQALGIEPDDAELIKEEAESIRQTTVQFASGVF